MIDPVSAGILGGANIIGGLLSGGEKGPSYEDAPYKASWIRKAFAKQLAKKYPGIFELPEEQMGLFGGAMSDLLEGKLAPEAEEALGFGAQEMMSKLMGQAKVGVAGRGGGPEQLLGLGQKAAGQIVREIAPMKAELSTRARETGVSGMPGFIEALMKPGQIERQKWGDIANLFLQTPGAAYLGKSGEDIFAGIFGESPTATEPTRSIQPVPTQTVPGYGSNVLSPISPVTTTRPKKPVGYGTYGKGPIV